MALNQRIIISARDRASGVFGNVAKNSAKSSRSILGVNTALQTTNSSLGDLNTTAGLLATGGLAALAFTLRSFTSDALNVKIDFDRIKNTLEGVTGSSTAAAAEFKFLGDEANRLGIELRPVAQSYSRLLASNNLLGIGVADTREIFTSFSEALISFGGTRQQSIRVFSALEQIAAKGVVSMEELRQQLGEALPGALALGAKSIGLTVDEFTKLVSQGKIASKDFLVPFARAVRDQFGGTAVKGAKLLVAEFNRSINVLDKVKVAFLENTGPAGGFADAISRIVKRFVEFADTEDFLQRVSDFGTVLGKTLEGLVNVTTALVDVLQPLSNTLTATADLFDKNVLGALAFAAALKGIAVAGRLATGVFASGAGAQAAASLSGSRPVSPNFDLRNSTLRSRASTGLGATRASFATRAFISGPQNKFTNRLSLKGVQQQVDTFGNRLKKLNRGALTGISRTATKVGSSFLSVLGPIGLMVGAALAAAAALSHLAETDRIQEGADQSSRASDAANDIRKAIETELKEISKSNVNFASDPELIRAQNLRVQGLIKTIDAQKKLGIELGRFSRLNLAQFERQVRNIRDIVSGKLVVDPEVADRELQNARTEQIEAFKDARNRERQNTEFFERVRNGLGVSTKLFSGELIKFAKELSGGGLDLGGIVKVLKPEALRRQAELREKSIKLESDKTTALAQELGFVRKSGVERLSELKLLQEFSKKVKDGNLTQDQAQDLLNKRVIALRKLSLEKGAITADRSVEAQEKELSFLKKNGESQLFRFKIQERYAEQVRKGSLTQEKANELADREIEVARQRLSLQETRLSSLSAITANSAEFGAVRAQGFLDRLQSQRTAQLQGPDRQKADQRVSEKNKENKDREEMVALLTKANENFEGFREDVRNGNIRII